MKPDFEKMNGLVPAVVQDVKTKQVLMLAYVAVWHKTDDSFLRAPKIPPGFLRPSESATLHCRKFWRTPKGRCTAGMPKCPS